MIYTITFNPSLDYIMQVSCFEEGKTNRSTSEKIYPGGKGFNVSTILTRLNVDNMALGFVGGFTGDYIEEALNQRNIKTDLIHIQEGMSRINVKVKGNKETEINGNGPMINKDELSMLMNQIGKIQDDDILILAGSVPSSLPSDIYQQILLSLSNKKVLCVVDASGDLLRKVLAYKPFLIKPNKDELEEFFDCEITSKDKLIELMHKLQNLGARNVIVSLGKDGAVLLDENDDFYYQAAFSGKLINSVGSGDSMIAGFIAGYLKYQDFELALKLGSACGSATAFSLDLATKEEIMILFGKY